MAGRFDPNKYVDVQERIDLLKKHFPDSRIVTDLMSDPADFTKCRYRARIYLDPSDPIPTTGYAFEVAGSGGANSGSHEENCETSCVGRALANMGLTGGENRASLQEMAKAMRQSYDAKKGKWTVRDDVEIAAGARPVDAPELGAIAERERAALAAEAEKEELNAKKAKASAERAQAQAAQAEAAAQQRSATQAGKAARNRPAEAPSQPPAPPAQQPAPAPQGAHQPATLTPEQAKELQRAYAAAQIPDAMIRETLHARFGVESFERMPAEISGQDMFTVLCGWIPKMAERAAKQAAQAMQAQAAQPVG